MTPFAGCSEGAKKGQQKNADDAFGVFFSPFRMMDPLFFLKLSLALSLPTSLSPLRLTAYSLSGAVSSTWRPVTMILAVLALAGAALIGAASRGAGAATTIEGSCLAVLDRAARAFLGRGAARGVTLAAEATGVVCRRREARIFLFRERERERERERRAAGRCRS